MAAQYPTSTPTYAPIVDGVDYPQAADLNQLYEDVTAIGGALRGDGFEHNLFPESSADARTLGTASKFWGLAFLKGVTLAAASELTIASGVVVAAQSYHRIDTEADAASDDLDTITASGVAEGFLLVLRAENVSRVVTAKDGSGNLLLNGDFGFTATDRTLTLLYDGTNWREIARSFAVPSSLANGATTGVSVDSTGFVDSATQPRCVVTNSGTQAVASTSETAFTFDTEEVDVGGLHEGVTNPARLTIPTGGDGYYRVTASVNYQSFAGTQTGVFSIRKGGATKLNQGQNSFGAATNASKEVSWEGVLAAAEYVEFTVTQSTADSTTYGSATTGIRTRVSIVKLW